MMRNKGINNASSHANEELDAVIIGEAAPLTNIVIVPSFAKDNHPNSVITPPKNGKTAISFVLRSRNPTPRNMRGAIMQNRRYMSSYTARHIA